MRKITSIFALIFMISTAIMAFGGYLIPNSGQLYTFQAGTTMRGIDAALHDAQGTTRLIKDGTDMFVLGWAVPDSGIGAFVCINSQATSCGAEFAKLLRQGANVANIKDFSALIKYLEENGWKAVSASQLPRSLRLLASMPFLVQMANSLPTFLFVPANAIIPPEFEQLKKLEG